MHRCRSFPEPQIIGSTESSKVTCSVNECDGVAIEETILRISGGE
jgi:hypothetical protein